MDRRRIRRKPFKHTEVAQGLAQYGLVWDAKTREIVEETDYPEAVMQAAAESEMELPARYSVVQECSQLRDAGMFLNGIEWVLAQTKEEG